MSLYQNSVLKTYLAQQDKVVISKAYKKFIKYFHNPVRQQNIREIKEEGFQQKFLMELFVNVFGYIINPDPKFNLTTEFKNEKGSKKADGAILKDAKALGVIELKSTKVKDLEKIRQQAFDYKANQTGCIYVVTSNFEKLRFYINNAVEFEEFDLFTLTEERFQLLYLCLEKSNILNNVPLAIKQASIQQEKKITDNFYKDYSLFKRELFRDLVKQNMKNEVFRTELDNADAENGVKNIKRSLFKKSQKLIDRFLFIFFAEDSTLLTSNSSKKILDKWKADNDFGDERPLYDLFKQYFRFLDSGRKGTESRAEIFAYNGGLFKPDAVLDSLIIDNGLLNKYIGILQAYDFDSQVDVNILGHIFENSLNEIESVNAEIDGVVFDKQKTKRKKDGVFYTPKYITKYIVDNTIGKLCNEKKTELKIVEDEYRPKRQNETKKRLLTSLETYREWLLQLTILDPACGSGAFLNQALDFLIKEHQYLDELQTKLLGGGFVFPNIENTVLENNIYGVDLNEESVEIAKLSLWLRTAQPRRKLNNLSSNIKCGNSLIDNKTVAGDKAFNWEEEFTDVFAKGGFDVVIGNPPYVPTEYILEEDKVFLEKTYDSAFGRINLYPIFYEKGIKILRNNGLLSFITPYTILKNQYYKEARRYILENTSIEVLIDFKGIIVFEDAAVDSIILTLKKEEKTKNEFVQISNVKDFQNQQYLSATISQNEILKSDDLSFNVSQFEKIIKRISKGCSPLKEVLDFNQGIITGGNSQYVTFKENELTKKVVTGSDFNRYTYRDSGAFIIYDTERLHRPRKKKIFEVEEKILLRQTSAYPICMIDTKQLYTLDTVHNGLILDDEYSSKYLLCLLNSKLLRFLYENSINESGKVFAQVKIIYIDPLPIKIATINNQIPFIENADQMLLNSEKLESCSGKFIKYFQSQFTIEKLTKKLQKWYELEFIEFIKELNKAIKKVGGKKLTKIDEMEWMDVFETKKIEAQVLKTEIDKIDSEIDTMVYELYGLSEDEIKIVEGSS